MRMTLEKMYYVVTMLCSPWQAYRQNKFTMMKIKDLYRSIDTTSNTKSTCCVAYCHSYNLFEAERAANTHADKFNQAEI